MAWPDTETGMISTFAIAFGMSADAFAASLGKGAALDRPRLREVLRTASIFAGIEALTPLVGWVLGLAAGGWVAAIDHWIAFGLLAGVGAYMLRKAVLADSGAPAPSRHSLLALVLTALATSIDAMAVGMSLAILGADVLATALAIGLATFVMTAGGMMLGRMAGVVLGRLAEAAGGLLLIGLGAHILISHIGGA